MLDQAHDTGADLGGIAADQGSLDRPAGRPYP